MRHLKIMPFVSILSFAAAVCAADAPPLPAADAEVAIPAQEWGGGPGPRTINVYVRYPGGTLKGVGPATGLMLSLHNWGGTGFRGTADPAVLTARYNVVVIGVDYVQSGPYDPASGIPYDFGWMQALDALRALHYVWQGLETSGHAFDKARIYATGGSGGGNVSLMANKLAPRTFACVVDLSGMARLTDDIAYGIPGRTTLNAGYSRAPESPAHLIEDAQALRFVGHPQHAALMQRLGNTARLVVVHGVEDKACPAEDAREMVDNLTQAGLSVAPNFITPDSVDGKVLKDCGHSLGDRTAIVQRFADAYLLPNGAQAARRTTPADFERRDEQVAYPTPNGTWVVSYAAGYPEGRFVPLSK